MRILHTSHTGLPDPRIEKTAMTMKKAGNHLIFLGGKESTIQSDAFHEIHFEPMVNNLGVSLNPFYKKRWRNAIIRLKPDVVHAHNLIVGMLMLDLEFPVIYDDHEFWSQQSFKYSAKSFFRRMASVPFARSSPKWEQEIIERYPVITVSENIASEHRKYSDRVFITKNYPALEEIQNLSSENPRKGLVYVGNDFKLSRFLPHRNMQGLIDIIKFDILSGLPHQILMEKLTHYKIGLTPWLQHQFHKYCEPNKHYEYLNAGLQVILTESLAHPFANEAYVHSFEKYSEIPEIIASLPDIKASRIMDHARKHYTWETQEQIIRNVYKIV